MGGAGGLESDLPRLKDPARHAPPGKATNVASCFARSRKRTHCDERLEATCAVIRTRPAPVVLGLKTAALDPTERRVSLAEDLVFDQVAVAAPRAMERMQTPTRRFATRSRESTRFLYPAARGGTSGPRN